MPNSEIRVVYKFVDGAHFFFSENGTVEGLCVAHKDLRTAFDEVGNQLTALYSFNRGETKQFVPAVPFEVFEGALQAASEKAGSYIEERLFTPSSTQVWTYNARS